jgi:NAD(P)-dependent dehydrogenase (short-subunit alcohol dehydrogenase family)
MLNRLQGRVAGTVGIPLDSDAPIQAYFDGMAVDFFGVSNTVEVAIPHLPDGASIVCTGSTGALMPHGTANPAFGAGGAAYTTAKRYVGRMVHELAAQLAPRRIRINAIRPYNVYTGMCQIP